MNAALQRRRLGTGEVCDWTLVMPGDVPSKMCRLGSSTGRHWRGRSIMTCQGDRGRGACAAVSGLS